VKGRVVVITGREEGREGETRAESLTSEAVETETDKVEGRAVDGKVGWGAEAASKEVVESEAG